ncbi:hypothetical protein CRH01_11060 [Chryseobacterium rhizosphaerae]|nr:hypothetical protein CRH01_11060 [Chryseobacterium rhizosphaerae]
MSNKNNIHDKRSYGKQDIPKTYRPEIIFFQKSAFRQRIKIKIQANNKIDTDRKSNKIYGKRIFFVIEKKRHRKQKAKIKIFYSGVFIGIDIKKTDNNRKQDEDRDNTNFEHFPKSPGFSFYCH